jgi:hypothetical protein
MAISPRQKILPVLVGFMTKQLVCLRHQLKKYPTAFNHIDKH